MTTITAPPELTDDTPAAVAVPRRSGWHDEDHIVWGIVRDPEAVFMPLCLGALALGMAVFDDQSWFRQAGRLARPQFAEVQQVIAEQEGPRQLVPQLYFAGGATVLAVLSVLGVLAALFSRRLGVAARRVSVAVATLGLAATLGAVRLDDSASFDTWLDRADSGFWLAVGGFSLTLLAAVIVRPQHEVTER